MVSQISCKGYRYNAVHWPRAPNNFFYLCLRNSNGQIPVQAPIAASPFMLRPEYSRSIIPCLRRRLKATSGPRINCIHKQGVASVEKCIYVYIYNPQNSSPCKGLWYQERLWPGQFNGNENKQLPCHHTSTWVISLQNLPWPSLLLIWDVHQLWRYPSIKTTSSGIGYLISLITA